MNDFSKLIKTPKEKIVATDFLLMAFNPGKFGARHDQQRPVDLACGHKALTKNRGHMVCPRCTEMLRRSIEDGSEDYVGFRNHEKQDLMIWDRDPCRQFNEVGFNNK